MTKGREHMASKGHNGQRGATRARVEQVRREQKSKERRRALLIFSVTGVMLLLIIGGVTFSVIRSETNKPDLSAVKSYPVTPDHVQTPVTYAQTPPAGGQHNPVWLNCATYSTPVPSENAVHSMEHGAVWVTYRPDLPADQVTALKAAMPSTYAVLSPFEGLKAPVVASAWGKQLFLDGVNDPRLEAFIRQYRQGSQAPESGAACTGGSDGTLPLDTGGGMPAPAPTAQP